MSKSKIKGQQIWGNMRAVKAERETEVHVNHTALSFSQSYGLFLSAQGQIIDSVTRITQGSAVAGTGNDS